MEVFLCVVFLFGLAVGSFLNVIIFRLPTETSFLHGRSFCPKCKKILSFIELIPVVSFLWLEGKCRHCRVSISLQYPVVEIATGLLFVAVAYYVGIATSLGAVLQFGILLVLVSSVVVLLVYDIRYYLIDNKVLLLLLSTVVLWNSVHFIQGEIQGIDVATQVALALCVALFFLLFYIATKGQGIGMGDVKLAFVLALLFSHNLLVLWLFCVFISGGILGVGLLILGKKKRTDKVPYAPFLLVNALVVFFVGQTLWDSLITTALL